MSVPGWRDEWARQAGVVGVIVAGIFLVVLAVFLYLVPLSRNQNVPRQAAGVMPTPAAPSTLAHYVDEQQRFELDLPAGWRRASVRDEERPALAADYDVVWEDPASGARVAVSAWRAADLASFVLWSALLGAGMQSVDGQLPTNALVAGQPALLLAAPETPTTPARYALFMAHGESYYRIAYTAHDGGGAMTDYARLLTTLRWTDDPAGAESQDLLPLRSPEKSRYWPGKVLFER